MDICLHCNKQITERYRVNEKGDLFCDDECYEGYYKEEIECTDQYHPYINDYEAIRRNYNDWLNNWEVDLIERGKNFQRSVDILVDIIDEEIEPYQDYYVKQGDDGVFSQEIYQYCLKFEELQRKILEWRPERDVYYYFSFEVDHPLLEKKYMLGEDFIAFLMGIQEFELYDMLKDHAHPYDEKAFYFDTEEEAENVRRKLKEKFGEDIEDSIYIDKAYLCDGECYDIEVIDNINMGDLDGWFFCDSCQDYYPGFFTKEELLEEVQLYEDHPIKNEYYKRKIKRSCRYHDVELPGWVYLIE